MFGYATTETPELMPAPIMYAHQLGRALTKIRKAGKVKWLRPDAKSLTAFRSQFAEKGKARIALRVNVAEAGETSAEFEGHFVARRHLL